ncbi:condensation domain-containing protein [Streptomyces sp. URMC 123]|uniref:condensation domain-containing protein n=1 Tax=Streptomyces sp. URMC 123 TaxID=3423403 RepID=UPI003F1C5325
MAQAPLTQRQFRFWLEYLNTPLSRRSFMHLVQFVAVPDGMSYAEVGAAVEHVVSRHDTLRTRFVVAEDGRYLQLIDGAGPPPLHRAEVDRVAEEQNDLVGAAAELVHRPVDLSAEWPVRVIALTVSGRLRQLCLVVHHVAIDREGLARLTAELTTALTAPVTLPGVLGGPALPGALGGPGGPGEGLRPDPGDRAERRGAMALRHWRATLPRMPGVVLPYEREEGQDLQRLGWIESSALATALPVLRQRLGLSLPSLLLAAFNLALTSWSGLRRWRWETIVNNRPRGLDPGTLGCFMDFTLVQSWSREGQSFADYAATVSRDMLLGVRHSVCDADRLLEVELLSAVERGTNLDAPLIYNFKDIAGDPRGAVPRSLPAGDSFAPAEVRWTERHDPALLFARVHGLGDVATVSLAARASLMSAEDHRRVLGAVERIVRSAAADPDVPLDRLCARVAAPEWPRKPHWTRLSDDRWADVPAIEEFLARRLGKGTVTCAVDDRSLELTAYAATDSPASCLAGLGRAVRDMLRHPGLQVPDRFVLRRPNGDEAVYRRHEVFSHTSAESALVGSEAERALRDVLAHVCGHIDLDFDRSYVEQGGRAEDLIRVHFALAARGWTGAPAKAVLGPSSLREIAGLLRGSTAVPTG